MSACNRIKNIDPRTDNEMDTEAAAIARAELAAQSKARYEHEAAELTKWNALLRQKVANAQDEDGWNEDNAKLCDLIAARQLKRESDVSTQQYIMFKNYLDKTAMGDDVRKQRVVERAVERVHWTRKYAYRNVERVKHVERIVPVESSVCDAATRGATRAVDELMPAARAHARKLPA